MISVNLSPTCFAGNHLECKYRLGGHNYSDMAGSILCDCSCHFGGGWDLHEGRANSSPEYLELCTAIFEYLRAGAASSVIRDSWLSSMARGIAAHLAHVWGFAPVEYIRIGRCSHHNGCGMNHTTRSSDFYCDHDDHCDLDHG